MGSARTCGRATAAGIALAAMLGWRNARAADDGPVPLIHYSNDALTVRLSGVQNSDILAELARQSGAEIRGQVREPREVTADFESVPLPEALARLLGEQDSALVYGEVGRLKAVRLLGGDQGGRPPRLPLPRRLPLRGRRSRPLSRSSSIAILPCRLPASLA